MARDSRTLERLALPLGLALGLRGYLSPLSNPDLYWHLSAARRFVETGALPRADFLSHTKFGEPWINFEWLTQLLYFGVHGSLGVLGLIGLRAAFLAAAFAAVVRLARLHGCGPFGQGLAALAAAGAVFPLGDLRADNVSLAAFAWLLAFLEARRLRGAAATARESLALGAGFALWANFHLGFLYGLLLLAAYAAGAAVEGRRGAAAGWLRALACCAAGTLATPFGWRIWALPGIHFEHMAAMAATICEWLPPNAAHPSFWPYFGVLALSPAALAWRYWTRRPVPPALAIGLLGFGALSLQHSRQLSYFSLFAVPALCALLAHVPSRWAGPLRRAGAAAFAALALLTARVPWMKPGVFVPAHDSARFLEAEKAALSRLPLYNTWEDGGYLGWALSPHFPVFMDGRYLFHDLLSETRDAARSADAWRAFMDRRDIRLACVRRSELNPSYEAGVRRPYFTAYMPRSDWALVHWDGQRLVFVRRGSVPAAWLAAREFRWLRPDGDPAEPLPRAKAKARAAVLSELERLTFQSPAAAPEAARLAARLGML